ncbi:TPA: DUF4105 domain-containing protein [Klebsiella pneumoniae]|uniref:Lnb N-terminal periplasmic domain-containing protein n=2 Tax=Klebsiella pneumoniae TaxID=573 RepID=UPI0024A96BB3|nr:DUF4105 domain-containing protein [Klebsiella pneumoniae]HDO7177498.1 DUF4105 domain-containing protein [Klebsiella pneumoniae]HDO7187923.1 DUF4105 domain-containing protein [Klebsiella pneumoniae]
MQISKGIEWLEEYSKMASISWFNDDELMIENVRNFKYIDIDNVIPQWDNRTYKISNLQKTDLVISYWNGNAIAHVFLTFGFKDNQWLSISIETRRKKYQKWSALNGFYPNYPLIYVVADEKDLIGVRCDIRKERVSLYPLKLSLMQQQKLLRSYLFRINELHKKPEWYNTLFNNCTTNILRHGKEVYPKLKFNWKVMLSGFADSYCYELGLLDNRYTFSDLKKMSVIHRNNDDLIDSNFSENIRNTLLAKMGVK